MEGVASGRALTVLVVLYAFQIVIAPHKLLANRGNVSDLQVGEGARVGTAAPVGEEQALGDHLTDGVALDGVCCDREEGRGRVHGCSPRGAAAPMRREVEGRKPANGKREDSSFVSGTQITCQHGA